MSEFTATQTVDQDDVKRIETETDIARRQGFAFDEPTLYPWGYRLAKVGQDSYRAERQALEDRPRIDALPALATEIASREARRDFTVDVRGCDVTPKWRIRTSGTATKPRVRCGAGIPISRFALQQLLSRSGALGGTVNVLTQFSGEIASACATEYLAHVDPTQKIVLRTKLAEGGERSVFAAVSERYSAYDLPEAAHDFAAIVGELSPGARCTLTYDGRHWAIRAASMIPFEPRVGDIQHGWVELSGSDDTSAALRATAGLEQTRCLNNSKIPSVVKLDGVKHLGSRIRERVREMLDKAQGLIQPFVDRWAEASREQVISEGFADPTPAKVFGALVEKGLVHVVGFSDTALIERLCRAYQIETQYGRGYDRATVTAVITRAAHTEAWASPWVTDTLEQQAGELLYNHVVLQVA